MAFSEDHLDAEVLFVPNGLEGVEQRLLHELQRFDDDLLCLLTLPGIGVGKRAELEGALGEAVRAQAYQPDACLLFQLLAQVQILGIHLGFQYVTKSTEFKRYLTIRVEGSSIPICSID